MGIVGTLAGVRASSARRYAERGDDAAALLAALSTTETSRFITKHSDTNSRLELSRVVRESAAVYAKQYPTPAGNDAIRMLTAVYAAMFGAFSVACLIVGLVEHGDRRITGFVVGAVFMLLAVLLSAIALTLLAGCNAAMRRVSCRGRQGGDAPSSRSGHRSTTCGERGQRPERGAKLNRESRRLLTE